MTKKHFNALQVAINGPANARTWLSALRFRFLCVSASEYLTRAELSQWLHDQWLDHPEDIVQDFLDAMVEDGFIKKGKVGGEVIFRCPQERLDRVQVNTPPACCPTCGGWHSMGGCSHLANGPDGCQCDPCRSWGPDAATAWRGIAEAKDFHQSQKAQRPE